MKKINNYLLIKDARAKTLDSYIKIKEMFIWT